MPIFLSNEELLSLAGDARAVADRADAFILDLRRQLKTVLAESDAASIAAEQSCAVLEQKYSSLSADLSRLQSENSLLSAAAEKRLAEVADAQSQKHQLHLLAIEKDGEIERFRLESAELQKSKRHLLGLIENKDAEIPERDATIQSYLDKIDNGELWRAKEELEKLKEEAQANKGYMLQYKEIAQTNETALKQIESAHVEYKAEAEKLKKALEDEVQSLQNKVSELESICKLKAEEVACAIENKESHVSSAIAETRSMKEAISEKLTQIETLEVQVSSLRENLEKEHNRWRTAQDNYERQVIMQSETIQELTKTSKELSALHLQIAKLKEYSEAQKTQNVSFPPMEAAAVLEVEGETLESLLEASRTPEGRSRLAAIPSLLPSLLLPLPTPLPHLRLLRNLLAGDDSPHLAPFLRSDGPQRISSLLEHSSEPELLRAALQVLANLSLSLSLSSYSLWAPPPLPLLSPSLLLSLSRVRHPQVLDPLCMLLYNSSSSSPDIIDVLVLAEIIATASTVGYQEEWFEWLLARICIEEPHFYPLFRKLRLPEQAFLLRILSNTLSSRPEEVAVTTDFALAVLKVAKEGYTAAVGRSSGRGSALPTGLPGTDVLGYSLTILRDVCAWEDPDVGTEVHLVDSLLSSGLLEFMLTALGELGPPWIVRKSSSSTAAGPVKACPYEGFRRDIVSVIANCSHRRKRAQDEVRERSGIFLLMQQCVVDEDNPFLREWGLLAIRNLLEGNAENQREVSELQLQGPVDTPEITGLGLKVEVDEKSGRAKLVNIS